MNKFICIAFAVFACIASGSCSGNYNNLAKLALGSYGNNPSSSSSSSSAAAAAPNSYGANYAVPASYGVPASYAAPSPSYVAPASYGVPAYGGHSYAAPIAAYNTPAATYTAPAKSYGPKYTVQPAYATELYPGQQNYKTFNSPATYSQVALPIAPSAPVAKLYVPAQQAYAGPSYSSGAY